MRSTSPTSSTTSAASSDFLREPAKYEFRAALAHGRTGSMYDAFDRLRARRVTVKLLAPVDVEGSRARRRFEQTASALCALEHPNIVPVYEYGYHYGMAYLAMEHVQGISLRDYLQRKGPLTWNEFVPLMGSVLEGLEAAHRQGLIHGDVQPSHVILSHDDEAVRQVRLLGFGLPDLIGDEPVASGDETKFTVQAGAVDAIAPEQLLGQAGDQRVDLYSLGLMAYHMLSGRQPFRGTPFRVLFQSIYEDPTPLADVLPRGHDIPQAAIDFVHKLLAKNPDDRPPDAAQARIWLVSMVDPQTAVRVEDASVPLWKPEVTWELSLEDVAAARPKSEVVDAGAAPERAPREASLATILMMAAAVIFVLSVALGWYVASGSTEEEAGSANEVVTHAAPAPRQTTRSPEILLTKIESALAEGRYGTAQSLLSKLDAHDELPVALVADKERLQRDVDVAQRLARARRLESGQRISEALAMYREILMLDPEHTTARQRADVLESSFVLEVKANVTAVVYGDEEPLGLTPFSEIVPVHISNVSVRRRGYRIWRSTLEPERGERVQLEADLVPTSRAPEKSADPLFLDELMDMSLD